MRLVSIKHIMIKYDSGKKEKLPPANGVSKSTKKRENKKTIKFINTVEGRQNVRRGEVWSTLNIYKMVAGYIRAKRRIGSSSCIS